MISFFTVLSWLSQEAYPILIGDLDPSGNLQANIIHAPSGELERKAFFPRNEKFILLPYTDNLRTKMMVAIMEGKWQNVQMTADYKVEPIFHLLLWNKKGPLPWKKR